jgi:hypothetical protein
LRRDIFRAIDSPQRRALLKFIDDHSPCMVILMLERWKAPNLYHHLEFLDGLIKQDSENRYLTTERGKKALAIIKELERLEKPTFKELILGKKSR